MKKFIRNLTKQKKSNAENQSISSKHSGRSCSTTSLDVGGYSVDVDTDDKSFTKLHKACWLGDYEKVKKHIKKNDVNLKDNYNRAPLHLAAVNGHNHIVLLLLEWNADPDVKDGDQKTPLIKAIENHHSEVAESLIHHGAKIEATDKDGNSPLLIALKNGQSDMAFALLGHGANVNVSNKERQTALHFATEKKLLGITKKLLEMGVSVDSADVYLRTPLMSACQTGFLPLVELILEHGADVTLKSNSGRTAEMFAKEEGHDAIVDILRSWGNKKPPKPEVKQQETDLPDAAGDNDSWNSDDSVVQEKPPIFPNLQTIVQMDDFQETVQLTPNAAKDNRSPENQDSANAVLSQVRQNLSQRPKKPTPSGQEELLEELGLSEGSDISSIKFDDSEISAQEEVKSKIKKSTSKISNKFDSSEEENQTSRKDDKPKETGAKPKLMVNVKTTKSKSDDDSYLDFSSEEDEEFMPSYVPSSLGNHNTSGGARKRTFSFDSDSNDVSAIPQHLQSTPKPISSLENVVKVNEAGNGAKDSVMHLRENIIVDKDVKKASSDANKGDDAHSIESWPTSSSESDEPDVQNKTLLSQIKENMTNKPEEKSTSLLKPESPGKKESSASSTLSGTLGKLGTLKAVEEIEESNAVLAEQINPESIFPTDVPPKKPPRRASLLHKTAEENKEVKKEVDGDNKEGLFGGDDTSTTVSDIHDGMGERKLSSDTLHSGDLQEELANSSNSFDDDDEDKSQSDDHLQLTSSLLSSPSKIGEIQTLLREYRLTIDKQKGESRALKSQVKSLSKENARLQSYKSQAESEQRSNAENLLKTLQQQVNVKEELYRREILAREEQSRTMKALENDFQGAQTLIKELKEKLLLLESELSNKDKTLQENEEHYNSLLKASEEASAKTKEATEERLTQIEEREKHLYEENKKLIEQFKSLKEETAKQMRAYQEKVNFLTSIKESLEQQLEETQKSIVLRDETLDRTSMEHTSQLITLKSENNKLKENLFNEQTAKKALENQVALLQQSLQELEQEKLERRQELCRLQQCLDVKEEELQRCREHSESETASLLKTNQQVLSQVSDLEKELGNAKSQLRQASKMYEEELKSLNKELSIAKETISAKDEILSSLEAELEEMKSLKRKALLELGNAKEENVVLTHKLETLEPKYISCQKERNHLQSNLDEAQAEIRSLIELKSKVQLLSSKTVELEHDYATMDAKYKGVLKENEHLRQELQHQRLQTESLEQKKKDTEESLMTSEKEIISLKADLNQTKQVKSNLERECHSLKEEVSVCKERLQITEAHLEGLKAEIQNVKFENIESQGSSSNEEVREIKDRLTETEKLVKQMAESMNGKKESSEKNFHAEPHLEHVKDVKEQLHQAERNLKVLSDNLHDIEGRMIGEGGKITSKETLGVHAHYPNMWNPKVDLQHPSSAALYHEQYGSMRGLLEDVAELKSHVKHMSNKIKELLDIHQLESRSSPLIEMAHIEEKLHDLQLQVQELTKHLRKEQDSNESHSDLDQHTVQTELLTLQKWQQELMIKVDTELKKLAAIQRKQVVWNESHEHRIWHELEALAVQELHHILGEFKMSFGQSMYTSTTKSYSQNAINDKQEQMEFLRAKNQLTQELSKLKSRITDDFGKRSQGHRSSTSSRSQKSFPSLEGQFQRKHTVKRPSALLHRKHNTKIASSTPIHTNSNFGNYMKWEPSPVTRKTSLLSHRINEETGSSQETSIKEIDDA